MRVINRVSRGHEYFAVASKYGAANRYSRPKPTTPHSVCLVHATVFSFGTCETQGLAWDNKLLFCLAHTHIMCINTCVTGVYTTCCYRVSCLHTNDITIKMMMSCVTYNRSMHTCLQHQIRMIACAINTWLQARYVL